MRTTIDVPDDLLRQAKATAALRGVKLEDFIAGILARALLEAEESLRTAGRRVPLPVMIPATGVPIPNRSNAKIFDALDQEEDERLGRSAD